MQLKKILIFFFFILLVFINDINEIKTICYYYWQFIFNKKLFIININNKLILQLLISYFMTFLTFNSFNIID